MAQIPTAGPAEQADLVIATGGLGPTSDDRTAAVIARAMGLPLQRHEPSLRRIEARFRDFGRPMPAPNAKQADLPQGADVLDNDVGTAPGFGVRFHAARAYFLPGVPAEMRHLFERHIAPVLQAQLQPTSHQIHLHSFGLRESEIAERLADIDEGGALHEPTVTLGYRPRFPEIEVKVLARAGDAAQSQAIAQRVAAQIRERLGHHVHDGGRDGFPAHVGSLLRARGLTLALAESCTGGLVAKLLTDAPGSSAFLRMGVVAYANEAKTAMLGVPPQMLAAHGAVSPEVARAMAEGAAERAGTDLAISLTGIAGPDGGSEDKPVGLVHMGLAQRGQPTADRKLLLRGDRARIRTLAAYAALAWIARTITDESA